MAASEAAVFSLLQCPEVRAIAAPDVEHCLVSPHGGEVERLVPDVPPRLLEPVDRLARCEICVGGVLLLVR